MTIIFDVLKPDPLALIRILMSLVTKHTKAPGLIRTETERHINDAVVVGLILIGVEKRHLGVISNQLVGENR